MGKKRIESLGPGHLRIFTFGSLKELLEYHGFQIAKTVGSGFYPFPPPIARFLCSIDKKHAAYIVVKARKKNNLGINNR